MLSDRYSIRKVQKSIYASNPLPSASGVAKTPSMSAAEGDMVLPPYPSALKFDLVARCSV